MKKFWYVSRDPATVGYHDPKQAFFTLAEAKAQAESLCKKYGHDFYVMESVQMVKQSKPPIEWVSVDTPSTSDKITQSLTYDLRGKLGQRSIDNRWYDYATWRWRDARGRFVK